MYKFKLTAICSRIFKTTGFIIKEERKCLTFKRNGNFKRLLSRKNFILKHHLKNKKTNKLNFLKWLIL